MSEVIPAEAIEAALKETGGPVMAIMNERAMVRRILEAAAPYMGAQSAWHDAVSEAYVEGALSAEQANVMWAKNPYRPTDAV